MNIIFQIEGGIGKCIAATAVCKAIKNTYPDSNLIVVSGYPDVFTGDKNVHKSLGFGQFTYFYSDYVEGKDAHFLVQDPYRYSPFLRGEMHLIEAWSYMFDLRQAVDPVPILSINPREEELYRERFLSDKPILLMQTNGGLPNQPNAYSWARDIPKHVVQAVVEHFKKDYTIAHLRRQDQQAYEGTVHVMDEFRPLQVLFKMANKGFFMDSFAQHMAAAMRLQSTVCWIANKPEQFGYAIHDNICAAAPTRRPDLRDSYLEKYNIAGNPAQFPYEDEKDIFDIDRIIASIEAQKNN